MTTYTVTGFILTQRNNGTATNIQDSELELVVPDRIDSLSYDVVGRTDENEPIVKYGNFAYNVRVDGVEINRLLPDSVDQFLAVNWDNGRKTSYIAVFYEEESNDSYVYQIGGDEVPEFNTADDFNTFFAGVTLSDPGRRSGFAEGDEISLEDIPNVKISQSDTVVGTRRDDVLRSGIGKDTIEGGRGDDVIDGGRGNDKLTGDGGEDTFIYKKKYGKDVVRDFRDDVDTLKIDDGLWRGDLNKREMLDRFASVDSGDVLLDFGRNELRIKGFTDIDALANDITII